MQSTQPTPSALVTAFLEENAVHNLSALRTPEACEIGNVQDSVAVLKVPVLQEVFARGGVLMDVGTGGGFPLLPLALALPQWRCVGIDATAKKVAAVGRIAAALGATNVEVKADRVEILAHQAAWREQADIVTARAVAETATLLEYTVAFARVGGWIVFWKSLHAEEEVRRAAHAVRALHCELRSQHVYDLGGDWGRRQLLVYQKMAPTAKRYPRAVGLPKKQPL